MVTVAVDAGGADLGPAEVAAGATSAAAAGGIEVLLYGPAAEIGEVGRGRHRGRRARSRSRRPRIRRSRSAQPRMPRSCEPPRRSPRVRRRRSCRAARPARRSPPDLFNVRRDRGIYRPALALPLPMLDGPPVLLLDVGANVSCRPEHLVQFAHMGSAFSHAVLGRERPRVALLSNGEEPNKGTPDVVFVHEQLDRRRRHWPELRRQHRGHRTSPTGVADVVVMDGFIGNITLKLIEGVSDRTLRGIRDAGTQLEAGQARRLAAAARDRAAARGRRPRTARRRVSARSAAARRRRPRPVHPARLSARDRGGGARCRGRCDQGHA